MDEMLINITRGDIPVVIIRPRVIESTYREPYTGWIQGNRVLDPFILSYGKGLLSEVFADPEAVIDVVPVDMVVNASIAAMAKHGNAANRSELKVYNLGSSMANPISVGNIFEYAYDHFKSSPLPDSKENEIGLFRMNFFSSMDSYSSYIH
ncbi:hypothetical protein L6164_017774 [Bauhinia variegata]|uniref:Uncharacterized protein n=1 Tax=Bauhinia variegata TaxID=167791 RepID=A0ACB9N9L8_BAUVA|nr:hypothetical protein L6164_017774 [Bauhinia variegata]